MRPIETLLAGPYDVAFAAAVATGLAVAWRRGRRDGYPSESWSIVLALALLGGVVGSKLIDFDLGPLGPGEKTILGGLVLGITAVVVAGRYLGLGALRALDSLTPGTLAAMAIGRVGCFLAGCCVGLPTRLPWGVTYGPHSEAFAAQLANGRIPADATTALPVHPVQLYEGGADVLLLLVLSRFVRGPVAGRRFFVAVAGYTVIRVLAEFVRDARTTVGPLSPVQYILLAILTVVLIALALLRTSGRPAVRRAQLPQTLGARARRVRNRASSGRPPATLVAFAVLSIALVPWFTPLERLVLVSLAITTTVVLLPFAMRTAPSLALAIFALQTSSDGARTEIVGGARYWRGMYESILGYGQSTGGDTCTPARRPTVIQERSFEVLDVDAGIRHRIGENARISLFARMARGSDVFDDKGPGAPVIGPDGGPVDTGRDVDMSAWGIRAMVETPNVTAWVGMVDGALSSQGRAVDRFTMTGGMRAGWQRGLFFEMQYGESVLVPALQNPTSFGVGVRYAPYGSRLYAHAGDGFLGVGTHLVLPWGFEADADWRHLWSTDDALHPGDVFTIGLRKSFGIR